MDTLNASARLASPFVSSVKRSALSVLLGLTLSASPYLAHAQEWGYQVTEQVSPGQEATFSLSSPLALKKVTLELSSGEVSVKRKLRSLKANSPYKVRFKPPKGSSMWQATLKGVDPEGLEQSVSFEFSILSAEALNAEVVLSETSLELGRLVARANVPLDHAELEAFGDEGQSLWRDNVTFKPLTQGDEQGKEPKKRKKRRGKRRGKGGAQAYVARYDRAPTPRRLEVKLVDQNESWVSVRLVRWFAEVPHEDVLFESGSAELKVSEEPKMHEAIEAVAAELRKYRRAMGDASAKLDLQLYVGGYTDTVGDAQDNLKLSQARARSIAEYFKRKGVEIPIMYAGFGERALLVKTPDNTDEARNRRALYIVANTPPQGEGFPGGAWRRLP